MLTDNSDDDTVVSLYYADNFGSFQNKDYCRKYYISFQVTHDVVRNDLGHPDKA